MMTMTYFELDSAELQPSLASVADDALEAWFADAGLDVEVVSGCDVAACMVCATGTTAFPHAA